MNIPSDVWNKASDIINEFKSIARKGGDEGALRDMVIRHLMEKEPEPIRFVFDPTSG